MIDRIKATRAARWGVAGAIVLAVGVAGAATKLKRSTSVGDACLCTPDTQSPSDGVAALDPARSSTSYLARNGGSPASGSSTAGALVAEPTNSTALHDGGNAGQGGWRRAGTVGWGNGSRSNGAYSSSSHGSGGGAALGGLWRVMGLSRRPAAREHVASNVSRPSASRPPRSVAPRPPSSRSPGGSLTAPAPAAADDLFAEQTTSIPDLLGPGGSTPSAGAGSLPGGRGGSGVGDAGALAATPEPGSLLLLGTGLIGVARMLRRRLA